VGFEMPSFYIYPLALKYQRIKDITLEIARDLLLKHHLSRPLELGLREGITDVSIYRDFNLLKAKYIWEESQELTTINGVSEINIKREVESYYFPEQGVVVHVAASKGYAEKTHRRWIEIIFGTMIDRLPYSALELSDSDKLKFIEMLETIEEIEQDAKFETGLDKIRFMDKDVGRKEYWTKYGFDKKPFEDVVGRTLLGKYVKIRIKGDRFTIYGREKDTRDFAIILSKFISTLVKFRGQPLCEKFGSQSGIQNHV
jgi:hypothetical protein